MDFTFLRISEFTGPMSSTVGKGEDLTRLPRAPLTGRERNTKVARSQSLAHVWPYIHRPEPIPRDCKCKYSFLRQPFFQHTVLQAPRVWAWVPRHSASRHPALPLGSQVLHLVLCMVKMHWTRILGFEFRP